jgi:hypothetical protein
MELISDKYRELNHKLHTTPPGFGASGYRWIDHIKLIVDVHKVESMLDYGCGQSTLWRAFKDKYPKRAAKIKYTEYDPCIPKKDVIPEGVFDLVACTDVLEHVEPAYLENVIEHIVSLTGRVMFLNIAIKPADKVLADGRNAHLIVKPAIWWERQLSAKLESEARISYMKGGKAGKDVNLLVEI